MTTTVKSLAKIAYASTHHKVALPELPEELWQDIFCSVCDISFMNISALDEAPRLLSSPAAFTQRTLRKAKILQRRLLLVCKFWHRIALSSFYEHLVVSNSTGLQKLSQILHGTSLGLQSKRLDVFLRSIDSINEEMLTSLLLLELPNLRILTLDSCSGLPSKLFRHIFKALPHLQVLAAHTPVLPEHFTTTTIQTIAFHVLSYPSSPGALRLALPNLRQAHITVPLNRISPIHESFPSVTSVIIGHFEDDYTSIFPVISGFFPSVQYIGIKCNLIELNFVCFQEPGQTSPAETLNVPATVHTLGLSFTRKARNRTYRDLCNTLNQIYGDGLQVIRFGDPVFADLQERPFALALVRKTIQDKGWCMEVGDMYV